MREVLAVGRAEKLISCRTLNLVPADDGLAGFSFNGDFYNRLSQITGAIDNLAVIGISVITRGVNGNDLVVIGVTGLGGGVGVGEIGGRVHQLIRTVGSISTIDHILICVRNCIPSQPDISGISNITGGNNGSLKRLNKLFGYNDL